MRRIRLPVIAMVMIGIIAACSGGRDPVANGANGVGLPEPADEMAPDALAQPPEEGATPANGAAPVASAAIPAALHGRWGLTPGDCTSRRGDAKGLLTITSGDLRFYESRAVPGVDIQADEDSISGHFNFTGEGQSWKKFEALQIRGTKLIRTETNPAASYTYAKC